MKKISIVLFLFCCYTNSFSQTNLVPNYGFEDTISCPQTQGGVFYSYTPPWFSPNDGTPDIFNNCSTISSGCNIPYTWLGYQQPHSGKGFGGFASYTSSNVSEYLSVRLKSPLLSNKKYCISFFVNSGNYTYYVTDAIGVYLSIDSLQYIGSQIIPFIPQIENPLGNIISDTVNWTKISGEFIASGGEQ